MDRCFAGAFLVAIMMVAFAIYIGWPCPSLSSNLLQWKNKDSSFFSIKKRKMFYKDVNGKGEVFSTATVLLLHGFPTTSYDWVKMWPILTQSFSRVIAVDFLGFGFSDKTIGANYTIMNQADHVSTLLKAIGVKNVHILSHDYGDSIAQELLARQNEGVSLFQIESACLLNGGMFKETNFPRPIQKLLGDSPAIGRLISKISNRYLFSFGLSQVFGAKTQPTEEDMYDFWCSYCIRQGYLNSADLLQYIKERSTYNLRWRYALAQSQVPVHVIYGPSDPVNPRPFIDFYREMVPNGSIDVLEESIGHYPQWEDSNTVSQLYIKFINSVLK